MNITAVLKEVALHQLLRVPTQKGDKVVHLAVCSVKCLTCSLIPAK